jgi:hypothetical protein
VFVPLQHSQLIATKIDVHDSTTGRIQTVSEGDERFRVLKV